MNYSDCALFTKTFLSIDRRARQINSFIISMINFPDYNSEFSCVTSLMQFLLHNISSLNAQYAEEIYISPILFHFPFYLCELNWRDKIFIWFWLAWDIDYCYALCIKIGKRRVYPEAFHLREIWICRDRSCRTWWSNGFICGIHTYSRLRQMIHEKTILHTCKNFL